MNTKRIIALTLLGVSLLLAVKIALNSQRPGPGEPDATAGVVDRAVPDFPIHYTIGNVDPRFGISGERFLQLAREAESVWEQASGKALFEYDPEATMKINLVFDWRQEKLLAANEGRAKLDAGGNSFDELQADYDARSKDFDRLKREFDDAADHYRAGSEEYAARVNRWNRSTDHPADEYSNLQLKGKALGEEKGSVERMQADLNARGEELNRFGARLTALAKEHNLDVENFNGTFVRARDFEKGVYDGKAINVYEFERESDLKLTLIHEFGHALGLGHIENPKAIMNQRLALQDHDDIRLTQDDLNLLAEKIK